MPEQRVISAELKNTDGTTAFVVSIDVTPEPEDCTCYTYWHAPGSVDSIRAGDTDPDCPHHGRS